MNYSERDLELYEDVNEKLQELRKLFPIPVELNLVVFSTMDSTSLLEIVESDKDYLIDAIDKGVA